MGKGHGSKEKNVEWISLYGCVLRFTTLRPLPDSIPVSAIEFDIELEIPSGGSADKELARLLSKVKGKSCLMVLKLITNYDLIF